MKNFHATLKIEKNCIFFFQEFLQSYCYKQIHTLAYILTAFYNSIKRKIKVRKKEKDKNKKLKKKRGKFSDNRNKYIHTTVK